MRKQKYDYDLIVIGSGAGGSRAADIVAGAGKRVAIVESEKIGGNSSHHGDIPMQALLEAAHTYERAKKSGDFGVRAAMAGFNYPSIQAWKETAVKRTGSDNGRGYYQSRGIGLYHGHAHFISPHEITVNRRHLSAEHFLIASGSEWRSIGVVYPDGANVIHAREALDLKRPPKHLFIIGGGATGTEFAELFSIFGSKVYIADIAPRLLPREDQEVSQLVEAVFAKRRGVQVLTKTKVTQIEKDGLQSRITFLRGGEQHSVRVDTVLIAAGKAPVTDIGLENAGVEYSAKGIEVNGFLQTSAKHIYAAGDATGGFMYTHTALYESQIAASNILSKKAAFAPDYRAVPRVTYLNPEVASVGLSEEQCLKRDMPIKSSIVPLTTTARANVSNSMDGFVKVITDKKGTLIGGSVVGRHAGEVIHELTLAIQYGLHARQVAATLHSFTSWSEALRTACEKIKI